MINLNYRAMRLGGRLSIIRSLYIVGTASAALAFKGIMASLFLSVPEFASYSIALLWSQMTVLLASAGGHTSLQINTAGYLKNTTYIIENYSKVISVILINFCLITTLLSLCGLFGSNRFLHISLGVLVGTLNLLFLVLTTKTKTRLDFSRYGLFMLIKAAGVLSVIGLAGTFLPRFETLLISEAIFIFFLLIYIYWDEFIKRSTKLHAVLAVQSEYRKHRNLFFLAIVSALFLNVDRIIGFEKLQTVEIATFGIIGIGVGISSMAQSVLNSIIFPKLTHKKIEQGQYKVVRSSLKVTFIAATVFTLGLGIVLPVLSIWFGAYLEAYGLNGNILCLAMLIMVLRGSDFLSNAYLVLNKEKFLIRVRLLLTLVSAFCIITITNRLEEILIITALASVSYSLVLALYLLIINEDSFSSPGASD